MRVCVGSVGLVGVSVGDVVVDGGVKVAVFGVVVVCVSCVVVGGLIRGPGSRAGVRVSEVAIVCAGEVVS